MKLVDTIAAWIRGLPATTVVKGETCALVDLLIDEHEKSCTVSSANRTFLKSFRVTAAGFLRDHPVVSFKQLPAKSKKVPGDLLLQLEGVDVTVRLRP